jgi:hypothetical protein
MRKVLRLAAAPTLVAALGIGCTSLLGDYTVSSSGGPGAEAGADSTPSDGSPATNDAANDVAADQSTGDGPDAADFAVKCDGFKSTTPTLVESLDSETGQNRSYHGNAPSIVTVSDSVVHIVSQSGGSFSFFVVDKQNPNQSGRFRQPLGDNEQSASPITNGTGVLAVRYEQLFNVLELFAVPKTQPPGQPLPSPFGLTTVPPNANNRFGASFLELAAGTDYFYSFTADLPDAGSNLYVGRRTSAGPGGAGLVAGNITQGGSQPYLLRAGSSMYVFVSSDPSKGGAVVYKVSDDGDAGAGSTGRPLSGATPGLVIAVGQGLVANRYNVGMIEFDPNSATALATMRVGSLDKAQLDTFKAPDLPKGPIFTDASELPVDKGTGGWFGDEFVMLGKGSPASHPGFNFVWQDAAGHLRAKNTGTNALLSTEPRPVGTAAMSLGQRLGTRYVTWNIVWTETLTSAQNGDYDVMYLNELICH